MRSWLAAVALLAGALAPAVAGAEELEWPEPIAWGEPVARVQLAQALREALEGAKWVVESDSGSAITARHEARTHVLRLRLDYGPQLVTYHYVDSANYGYAREGERQYIHRRANKLIKRLDREVRTQVQRVRFERGDEPETEIVPVLPEEEPQG